MKKAILASTFVVMAAAMAVAPIAAQAGGRIAAHRAGEDGRSFAPQLIGGPFLPNPDLDLPADPTLEQQIAAGKKELAKFQRNEPTLDQDQEFAAYMKDVVSRLLDGSDIKPPYAIEVHVSTGPTLNAFSGPGGQILFYSEMVEEADTEAQMVAIVAHELSHEIHNDFASFWKAMKAGADSYGKGGLIEQSREIEARADRDAAHLMYNAGWDPQAEHDMMARIAKRLQVMRGGHRLFYSSHPEEDRVSLIDKEIATLPRKPGLVNDSPRFQELKKRL